MAPKLWADSRTCPVAAIGGSPLTATSSHCVASWAATATAKVAICRHFGDADQASR